MLSTLPICGVVTTQIVLYVCRVTLVWVRVIWNIRVLIPVMWAWVPIQATQYVWTDLVLTRLPPMEPSVLTSIIM